MQVAEQPRMAIEFAFPVGAVPRPLQASLVSMGTETPAYSGPGHVEARPSEVGTAYTL
jgi:hypothetical protein